MSALNCVLAAIGSHHLHSLQSGRRRCARPPLESRLDPALEHTRTCSTKVWSCIECNGTGFKRAARSTNCSTSLTASAS